jgi:hypothetical protein
MSPEMLQETTLHHLLFYITYSILKHLYSHLLSWWSVIHGPSIISKMQMQNWSSSVVCGLAKLASPLVRDLTTQILIFFFNFFFLFQFFPQYFAWLPFTDGLFL